MKKRENIGGKIMANEQNLKPFTKENAKEMGAKGGKKKGENALERKTLKEAVEKAIENKYGKVLENIENGLEAGKIQWYELARKISEGENIKLSGGIKTEMESPEERLELFKKLTGAKSD